MTSRACTLLHQLTAPTHRRNRLRHLEVVPARPPRTAAWPHWVDDHVVDALRGRGVEQPWVHQVAAAEHVHARRHVVLATGTASGKSLGYLLPVLSALARAAAGRPQGVTALY
ncbi:MAG: hypothetical protein M3P83_05520, partial [Actinomycetota bacterium]|nr:hypothetical protein [Actinomycetota bacterium]